MIGFVMGLVGIIYRRIMKQLDDVRHEIGCMRDHVDATAAENDMAAFKAMDAERLIHWSSWRKAVDTQISETRRMLDVVSDRVTRARERLNSIEEIVRMRRNRRHSNHDDRREDDEDSDS